MERPKCRPGLTSILLINEDRLNDVVNKNKTDFQEVLGKKIENGSQLMREAKDSSLINDVLGGHQGLIGTVLGYGRDNSWLFFEACKNHIPMGCVWGEENDPFVEDSIDSDISLTNYYLSLYSRPSFAGDPNSEESLALKAEYTLAKQMIVNYYKDKDFLEATLSLLAGYYPPEFISISSVVEN